MGRTDRLVAVVGMAAVLTLLAVVAALVVAGNRWEGPALAELDLGAADADAASGTWSVEELVVDGDTVPLADDGVVVDLDTIAAVVTADAGCNALLGSFTLRSSGGASFTVPSARFQPCDPVAGAQEDALLEALARTSTWDGRDGRLVLVGPGARVELRSLERGPGRPRPALSPRRGSPVAAQSKARPSRPGP